MVWYLNAIFVIDYGKMVLATCRGTKKGKGFLTWQFKEIRSKTNLRNVNSIQTGKNDIPGSKVIKEQSELLLRKILGTLEVCVKNCD